MAARIAVNMAGSSTNWDPRSMAPEADALTRSLRDPQLATLALGALPVWLFSTDGSRILWANAAGAAMFGRCPGADLAVRSFGPADQHRRQVARLARELGEGAFRIERLQGFGAQLGRLRTCACSRFTSADGTAGLLIAAVEPAGRTLALRERVQLLLDGLEHPAAAFEPSGRLIGTNAAAVALSAPERSDEVDLALLGRDLVSTPPAEGHQSAVSTALGEVELYRLGHGGEMALLALLPVPEPAIVPEPEPSVAPEIEPAIAEAPAPTVEPAPVATMPAVVIAAAATTNGPKSEALPVAEHIPAPEPPPEIEIAPAQPQAAAAIETANIVTAPAIEPTPEPLISERGIEPPAAEPIAAAPEPMPEQVALVAEEPAPQHDAAQPAPDLAAVVHEATIALENALPARRHPLRFIWQMDADGRFALGADEFSRLIGPHTATAFGRPWREIAERFGLDPDNRVAAAVATRDTWSGITLNWPVDGADGNLRVELSGLPVHDSTGRFIGYRGFGICRDLHALDQLAAQRRRDALRPPPVEPPPAEQPPALVDDAGANDPPSPEAELPARIQPVETPVETPPNVVPFRPANETRAEPKTPTLTPVENHAFNELARQLASRLEAERAELDRREAQRSAPPVQPEAPEAFVEEPVQEEAAPAAEEPVPAETIAHDDAARFAAEPPRPAPRADARRDALLYDRMPVGILVYQLDRLLYANRAFLDGVGYADLQALAAAGGLDALYVEAGDAGGSSTTDEGTPVRISGAACTDAPAAARLHSISWDGEPAHALIFSAPHGHQPAAVTAPAGAAVEPAAVPAEPAPAAHPDAADLNALFDASEDATFILDRDGGILRCNGSARRLFGMIEHDAVQGRLADLFDPAGQAMLREEIEAVRQTAGTVRVRELSALTRERRLVPLRVTVGRSDPSGARLFAICRPLPATREPPEATQRRQAERAANARADILTRISQDLRTPLNAIVGFTDVMIEERFGAIGNERYAAYLKDIRASAERMLATINDMVDLSRAETGQLQLSLGRQDLNETVEHCVAVLQPQANRERIIIRTSLAQSLPPVTADAAALRQIVLNLVGNSIHVARAGGQIIVSTAVSDLGDVVLRVRDTGRGLSRAEMEAALEQFRNPTAEPVAQDNVGINMSLTRALVEANRAQFNIKSAPHSGTLIEVAFPPLAARAG